MDEIRELTKAEDQVMRILWRLKKCVIKDIADNMPEPKPAYTTVATVVKVLKTKGFIDTETIGNTHVYFPLIAEKEYARFAFEKVFSRYFDGSYQHLVSFLVEDKKLDAKTREGLTNLAEKLKKN